MRKVFLIWMIFFLNFIDLNILFNVYLIFFYCVLKICKYYFKGVIKKEDEGIRYVKCLY